MSFIVADPFNTGEGVSLEGFYERSGFEKADGEMYLEITGKYRPREKPMYEPLPEDRGRVLMFYDSACEWGYPFAVRVRDLLKEIDPDLLVELIDKWRQPEEYMRRGNETLIVNATVITSLWTEREAFRREVEQALGR